MKRTGLLGGSFNPVHTGHLMLASWLAQEPSAGLDEVWLSLTPDNPLKQLPAGSPPEASRLAMLGLALRDAGPRLRACAIELTMPRPCYTIDTLRLLRQRCPGHAFRLVIGSDNWLIFDRWRDHEAIRREFGVTVYPRLGYPVDAAGLPEGVELVEAPVVEVSSTMVRDMVARGLDPRWYVPEAVGEYIRREGLYSTNPTLST